MPVPPRRSVCVFCGARPGTDPAHGVAARELGRALAEAGMRLVYGAGDVGLMGAVAAAAAEAGGASLGVVPQHLIAREALGRDRAGIVVTETMHERKKVMFMNADAIVALPGGAGTLDELIEVLTWRQLGLHAKPVFLLDTGGYWDPLRALFSHIVDQGFAHAEFLGFFEVAQTVPALMEGLRARLG
jgi:uncharacterized protein (TIGR00730 family)